MTRYRLLSSVFCLLFSFSCLLPSAYGQSATATLSGTVEDQNGAVVPGAEVKITNPATAFSRQTTTNDSGGFTFPLLPPGTFTITTQREGFAPIRVEKIVLNVGDQKALRIELTVPTSLPITDTVYSVQTDLRLPYTLQWNLAVEQSLGKEQVVSLSYVAAAARQLLTTQSLNQKIGSAPRPNENFANIIFTSNGSRSDYNSLQVQYRARLKRSLQALVNYTWSHAIDEVSTDLGTLVLTRGNADFDVRHNFSAAIHYDVPTLGAGSILKAMFHNWSIDTIIRAQSGRPINLRVTGNTFVNGIQLNIRPDYIQGQPLYINDPSMPGGRRFNAAAFKLPAFISGTTVRQQGSFGRNVMRELPIYQTDLAIGRLFSVSEKFKIRLKGELFNIFNHPMFSVESLSTQRAKRIGLG